MSIDHPETFDYDTENNFHRKDAGYYTIDQYDLMPLRILSPISSKTEVLKMANVFEATADEVLRSVSVETYSPDTEVTLSVYLLNDDFNDPEDGKLHKKFKENCKYAGFHRISLEEGLYVPKGRSYSIVEELTSNGEHEYLTPLAVSEELSKKMDTDFYCVGVINENESYLFSESEGWKDWAAKSKEVADVDGYEDDNGEKCKYAVDNFNIKGYADILPQSDDESKTGRHGSGGGSSPVNYTLTFDTNGGSALNSVTKAANDVVDLSKYRPVREGYTFEGWYSDSELTKQVISITLNSNMTVYAKWSENKTDNNNNKPDSNKSDTGDNKPNSNKPDTVFSDVPEDAYYADAVEWAVKNNITTGKTESTFAPDESCTRAQMVTFLL